MQSRSESIGMPNRGYRLDHRIATRRFGILSIIFNIFMKIQIQALKPAAEVEQTTKTAKIIPKLHI